VGGFLEKGRVVYGELRNELLKEEVANEKSTAFGLSKVGFGEPAV